MFSAHYLALLVSIFPCSSNPRALMYFVMFPSIIHETRDSGNACPLVFIITVFRISLSIWWRTFHCRNTPSSSGFIIDRLSILDISEAVWKRPFLGAHNLCCGRKWNTCLSLLATANYSLNGQLYRSLSDTRAPHTLLTTGLDSIRTNGK